MQNNSLESLTSKFQKIAQLLKSAHKILVASHETPDADAVGSLLSLHRGLKEMGFKTFSYLPDSPPRDLSFLPDFFEIKTEITEEFLNADIAFCLDYGDFERLRMPNQISCRHFVTIDHHFGDQKGDIKIIEPKFSSTSEIIYYFFENLGLKINKEIATSLLAGIISDSGGFSHISTSSQTMKVASRLLLVGAPLAKIVQQTLSRGGQFSSPNASKIWGRALSRIKNDEKTGLAYSWLSLEDLKELGVSLFDLAGISSMVSTVSSTNLSLFLVEYEKGKIKGSLRSEPFKGKSVVGIAEALGGGGHLYAAGFKQEGTIEEVLKKVIELIE